LSKTKARRVVQRGNRKKRLKDRLKQGSRLERIFELKERSSRSATLARPFVKLFKSKRDVMVQEKYTRDKRVTLAEKGRFTWGRGHLFQMNGEKARIFDGGGKCRNIFPGVRKERGAKNRFP